MVFSPRKTLSRAIKLGQQDWSNVEIFNHLPPATHLIFPSQSALVVGDDLLGLPFCPVQRRVRRPQHGSTCVPTLLTGTSTPKVLRVKSLNQTFGTKRSFLESQLQEQIKGNLSTLEQRSLGRLYHRLSEGDHFPEHVLGEWARMRRRITLTFEAKVLFGVDVPSFSS